jgi:hypothetical protein
MPKPTVFVEKPTPKGFVATSRPRSLKSQPKQ